jgi:hypothetical protein
VNPDFENNAKVTLDFWLEVASEIFGKTRSQLQPIIDRNLAGLYGNDGGRFYGEDSLIYLLPDLLPEDVGFTTEILGLFQMAIAEHSTFDGIRRTTNWPQVRLRLAKECKWIQSMG